MTRRIDPSTFATVRAFKQAMGPVQDRIYNALVRKFDCGPFDGGCVAFARALQEVIGGEVAVVLRRGKGWADHAAVYKDGKLIDFDGPAAPAAFCRRFSRNEYVDIDGWRLWKDGDLSEAPYDDAVHKRLVKLLKEAFLLRPARIETIPEFSTVEANDSRPMPKTAPTRGMTL
jgi:hypothetical protein